MSAPAPLSFTPRSRKYSAASVSLRSTNSLSICALITTASVAKWFCAYSCTAFTWSVTGFSSSRDNNGARSVSPTLHANSVGLAVSRKNPPAIPFSSSVNDNVTAGFPASRWGRNFSSTAFSAFAGLDPARSSFCNRSRRF